MKTVCILNSTASYERIKNEIDADEIQWFYENSIDKLRLTLATDYYDIAIVDTSIDSYDDYVSVLELKDVKIIIFRGTYDQIVRDLQRRYNEYLEEQKDEEEYYIKRKSNQQEGEKTVNYTINKIVKTERIEVPVPVIQNVGNTTISIVNLSERAGSTFIASNLARAFALNNNSTVTLFESPIGTEDAFYTMGIIEEEDLYYSYRKGIRRDGFLDREKLINVKGVAVAAIEPETIDWDEKDTLRLLANSSGINIFDIGWNYEDERIRDILNVSQEILVIVDPLSTQIVRNRSRLESFIDLEKQGLNIKYVFNKWDNCIGKKKFIEGLGIKPYLIVEFISPKIIYSTHYKRTFEFVIDQESVGENILKELNPLVNQYVSYQEKDKKRGGFLKLFK